MPSKKLGSSVKRPWGPIKPGAEAGDHGAFIEPIFGMAGTDRTLPADVIAFVRAGVSGACSNGASSSNLVILTKSLADPRFGTIWPS